MKNTKKYITDQSGQMVILVMLVLVVALTIGLSLISRTISNTRQSTNTELSNRAYSAAEAGVEEALRAGGVVSSSPQPVGSGTGQATYSTKVTTQGNSSDPFVFPNPLSQDEAVQLWLFDYSTFRSSATPTFPSVVCSGSGANTHYYNECAARDLTLHWGSTTPSSNDKTPALEVALIYRDGSNNFQIEKCAFDPYSLRNPGNGFSTTNSSDTTVCNNIANSFTTTSQSITTSQGTKTFNYHKKIRLANANVGASSQKKYLLMRLKLLYNDQEKHELAVVPSAVNAGDTPILPAQGQIIESEGNAGEVVRKIKVYQSFPTLPGIFDFVLFNGSTNPLQK